MLSETLTVLRWIFIIASITLTLVVFCFLCCTPRKHRVSVLFVTNLLLSNLVLIGSLSPWELIITDMGFVGFLMHFIYATLGLLLALITGFIFRLCIAVERYMIIAHTTYIRGTCTSALACVAPWVLGVSIIFTSHSMDLIIIIIPVLILLSILLSVIFVVLTFVALPAASSVPIEEKRRTVGVLVLLLVDFVLIIPALILFINSFESFESTVLVLFTVFVDLALSVLMFKGPVDRFLARLCYCMKDKSLENGGVGGHYVLFKADISDAVVLANDALQAGF